MIVVCGFGGVWQEISKTASERKEIEEEGERKKKGGEGWREGRKNRKTIYIFNI